MQVMNLFGTRCVAGEGLVLPNHDNENWPFLSDWMTPAEAVQMVQREKERMRRQLAENFALRSCPQFQQDWDAIRGMEQTAARLGYSGR